MPDNARAAAVAYAAERTPTPVPVLSEAQLFLLDELLTRGRQVMPSLTMHERYDLDEALRDLDDALGLTPDVRYRFAERRAADSLAALRGVQ